MRRLTHLALAVALAAALAGCSTLNSLTGQTDDTVLPGQREDAIPGRAQFPDASDAGTIRPGQSASDPLISSEPQPACPDGDPACAPPVGNDTFSDPQ